MALSKNKLKDNILSWFNEDVTSIFDFTNYFSDAYEDYALDCIDISGDSILTYNKAGMKNILNTLTNNETTSSSALKFENSIITFWTEATFKLTIPPTGTILPELSAIVTTNIIPGVIKTPLISVFSDLSPNTTKQQKADQLATVFHTATLTVVVTCVGTHPSTGNPVPVVGNIS